MSIPFPLGLYLASRLSQFPLGSGEGSLGDSAGVDLRRDPRLGVAQDLLDSFGRRPCGGLSLPRSGEGVLYAYATSLLHGGLPLGRLAGRALAGEGLPQPLDLRLQPRHALQPQDGLSGLRAGFLGLPEGLVALVGQAPRVLLPGLETPIQTLAVVPQG